MFSGVENTEQKHYGSTDSFELRRVREQGMDTQQNDFSTSEVTHQSVSAQIKLQMSPFSDMLRNCAHYWLNQTDPDIMIRLQAHLTTGTTPGQFRFVMSKVSLPQVIACGSEGTQQGLELHCLSIISLRDRIINY